MLFVCNLNSVRSPIAAGLLHQLLGHRIYVKSAGVREGEPDLFAEGVMNEIGIDISKHRPSAIEELGDMSFDLIVTLTPQAHHVVLDKTRTVSVEVEYWPTIDPTFDDQTREARCAAYRSLRDSLAERIRQRFRSAPPVV